MRGSLEALYSTDDWGAKVLDLLSFSRTANTYSNRDNIPVNGPDIGDIKRALQIRQLNTKEEQRGTPLPGVVIIDILDDLATLPMTTHGYGTILREGDAVC
eukprot:jgi/Tetstr1/461759/TSEL_006848.t1